MAAAITLLVAGAGVARAEIDTQYGAFSADARVVSDYRFRGISRSGENPALQGGARWEHKKTGVSPYASVRGSSVNFNAPGQGSVEVQPGAGFVYRANGLDVDLGVTGSFYPGATDSLEYDYWEGKATATYDLGPAAVSGGVHYSPDYFQGSSDSLYSSVGASAPIADTGVKVKGEVGHMSIDNNTRFSGIPDYNTWRLGASYEWKGFDVAAEYTDTSVSSAACREGCDGTGIVSVSRGF